MKKFQAILCGFLLLFISACGLRPVSEPPIPEPPHPEAVSQPAPNLPDIKPVPPSYVRGLAKELADQLSLRAADGEEAIRAAYKYLIGNVYFATPVQLDIWRYLSDEASIPYIENRALSPFLFKIGSCEDFAAAMTLLLEAAGFEAQYVAGYTLSVDHVYVDHAWAAVKLQGQWYHIDPQLEQNVVRGNNLTYRYYLKSDTDMYADHKWGENLIEYWSELSGAEKQAIREQYTPRLCPESYPPPEAEFMPKPPKPNMTDVEQKARDLRLQSGKDILPPIHLQVEPPVLVKQHHITPPLIENPPAVPYGRGFLTGETARLYDRLYAAFKHGNTDIRLPLAAEMSGGDALGTACVFLADYPAYDWAAFSVSAAPEHALTVTASLPDAEIARRQSLIDEKTAEILSGIPTDASDFEKALYIHDYLAGTVLRDEQSAEENGGNIYGALVEGAACFNGYAKSFQYLCMAAGLDAAYIYGTDDKGGDHAWNAVRIDGEWYYMDVISDCPADGTGGVRHDYFMRTLDEMNRGHIPAGGQYVVERDS